jgi:hypothetical protein
MTDPADIPALQDAIRRLHSCEAIHVTSVPVNDTHDGKTVWEGEVEVFQLVGHPTAARAYAWSEATTGTQRRFFTVLHGLLVDSPEKAVHASIFADVEDLERAKKTRR